MFDNPLKQWPTGRKRGEDGNTYHLMKKSKITDTSFKTVSQIFFRICLEAREFLLGRQSVKEKHFDSRKQSSV